MSTLIRTRRYIAFESCWAHDMEQRDGKGRTSETVGLPARNDEEVAGVSENESRGSASVHEGSLSSGLRERANTGAASPRAHSRIDGVRAFDETMLDDYFSNFTDADWAKWDELNTASLDKGKAKNRRSNGKTVCHHD